METIEVLTEKLRRAEERKAKAEAEIKRLKDKIEQEEAAAVKAVMKQYNIGIVELSELLKNHSITDITNVGVVADEPKTEE